jgi:hypothetical protein
MVPNWHPIPHQPGTPFDLPKILFNDQPLKYGSGIYSLTVKYSNKLEKLKDIDQQKLKSFSEELNVLLKEQQEMGWKRSAVQNANARELSSKVRKKQEEVTALQTQMQQQSMWTAEAGIIIGGIEFNNTGNVNAEGADWDRVLAGQRQTQLPYSHGARGVSLWMNRKISEPWEDGDVLRFKVDVKENTVVFQKGDMPRKVLWNVLQFSNQPDNPDFVHLRAFCIYNSCGHSAIIPPPAQQPGALKLTIIHPDSASASASASSTKKNC